MLVSEKDFSPSPVWDLEVKIRSSRGVVKLTAFSKVFEEFFKSLSGGKKEHFSGGSYWALPNSFRPNLNSHAVHWATAEQPLFTPGNGVNLTWLRLCGLGEGISVTYGYPMSERVMDATVGALETVLRELFETYLNDQEVTLRMKSVVERKST